jgi:hypothetical protein
MTDRVTNQVAADPGLHMAPVLCSLSTVETVALDTANSLYYMAVLPSNAILLPQSEIFFDDLNASGSPTLDIGLAGVTGQITADVDALNDGIAASTATSSSLRHSVIKPALISNVGKKLWEYVSGQTTDPNGELYVTVKLLDADIDAGGTLTLSLFYTLG